MITPELRVVDVRWSEGEIQLRFVVDTNEHVAIRDLANEIEGEIEADFLPDAHVQSEVVFLPGNRSISEVEPLTGEAARVFARHEDYAD